MLHKFSIQRHMIVTNTLLLNIAQNIGSKKLGYSWPIRSIFIHQLIFYHSQSTNVFGQQLIHQNILLLSFVLYSTWRMVNMLVQNSLLVCSTIDCTVTHNDWNTHCWTGKWSLIERLDSELVTGPNQPRSTGRSCTDTRSHELYSVVVLWAPYLYRNETVVGLPWTFQTILNQLLYLARQ